jgi:hypothetical protein
MNSFETNRIARELVANELIKRGIGSIHTSGKQKIRMHATSRSTGRTITIQVKSKRKGNWHSTIKEGQQFNTPPDNENQFWIFIALEHNPRFWIVPDWWIRDYIQTKHQQYLDSHGGHRPVNDESDHCSISVEGIHNWENRWEELGVLATT